MANCSFLKATDARTRSRNDTLIWTEICEVQQAILAAIDSGAYSTIVSSGTPFTSTGTITGVTVTNGGTLYDYIDATGLTGVNPDDGATYTNGIYANGTGGTGAAITPVVVGNVVTSVTVDSGGSGYTPVSATATVDTPYNLNTGQTDTNFNGTGTEGTFTPGADYFPTDTITLSDSTIITVNSIDTAAQKYVLIDGQGNANYPNVYPAAGSFNSGAGYLTGDTITLGDGSIVSVTTAVAGAITAFTIDSTNATSAGTSGELRGQYIAPASGGSGFVLVPDAANENIVGPVETFSVNAVGSTDFFLSNVLSQTGTTTAGTGPAIGTGFSLSPNTGNATPNLHSGVDAVLTPIVTNGVVTSVVVNSGGTLYTNQNPVSINHPSGQGATAVANVIGGVIQTVDVLTGGSGYEISNALVALDHPTGTGFVGVVNTTGGVITSVSVQDGGALYGRIYPTAVVGTSTGSGASFRVNLISTPNGSVDNIEVVSGGNNYTSADTITVVPTAGDDGSGATATLTVDANNFGTTATDYYSVLSGQATDAVIADQIQYVLDYFTALGYNIRAQVNPSTGNTLQWQIIW
jgi:hypothetical protein